MKHIASDDSFNIRSELGSTVYLNRKVAVPCLHGLIYKCMRRKPLPKNMGNDYEASVMIHASVAALGAMNRVDFSSLIPLFLDKRKDYRLREPLMAALSKLNNEQVLQALLTVASDSTEYSFLRFAVLSNLSEIRDQRVDQLLKVILQQPSEKSLHYWANRWLEERRKKFGGGGGN